MRAPPRPRPRSTTGTISIPAITGRAPHVAAAAESPSHHDRQKAKAAEKETGEAAGPDISISIDQQKVRVTTQRIVRRRSVDCKKAIRRDGVFSIIQKHKMHHSNIYSGAPMPFMQRITWSGVAMHQGVLPGYPASHGCIRMPAAFAVKMWNWTKMGARVLVTPGDVTPALFSHPLLVTQKAVPVANEAPQVDAPLGVKSDKGADATHEVGKPTDTADAKLELRSTVGHARTQTADASGALPASAAVTISDASPAAASGEAAPVKVAERAEAEPEAAKSEKQARDGNRRSKPAPSQCGRRIGRQTRRSETRRDRGRRDQACPGRRQIRRQDRGFRQREGRGQGSRAQVMQRPTSPKRRKAAEPAEPAKPSAIRLPVKAGWRSCYRGAGKEGYIAAARARKARPN